jgi:hypothetical protein
VVSTVGKCLPLDLLQVPDKVQTRKEAIEAIRTTEKICNLIENQHQYTMNSKFIIATLIANLFTEVAD